MRKMIIACAALAALVSQGARAGQMEEGCVGKTRDGQRIAWNAERLVIMDADLAAGVLRKDTPTPNIDAYGASGGDGLTYSHTSDGKQVDKLVLREVDRQKIKKFEERAPCSRGAREITYTLYKKTYELSREGQAKPEVIKVECYRYEVTTCG